MMTYEEACAYFDRCGQYATRRSDELAERYLKALGNPDRKSGMVIHVAGTNGKGSVCAFLSLALKSAGIRTGLFTSPHLVRINERISVDGEPISDSDFVRIFERIAKEAASLETDGKLSLPYFCLLFLMAMVYFEEQGVGAAVIETGMGGRLDATNAMKAPAAAVITSIGLDHTKYLGDSIEKIAGEKAGILKKGVPCIYDASDAAAAEVIRKRAEELGIPSYPLYTQDYRITECGKGEIAFSTSFRYDGRAAFAIHAAAPYQAANAALAVLTFCALRETDSFPEGISLNAEQLENGLSRMFWPARMEEIRPRVYLDGAHNPPGITRLCEAARFISGGADCHLLFGVMADKDYRAMVHILVRDFPWKSVTVTQTGDARGLESREAAELFLREGQTCVLNEPDFGKALKGALERQGDDEYLIICGSLYLAGMCGQAVKEGA